MEHPLYPKFVRTAAIVFPPEHFTEFHGDFTVL